MQGVTKLEIFFPREATICWSATINIYFLIEIRLNILIECRGNYIDVKNVNHMFQIDFF